MILGGIAGNSSFARTACLSRTKLRRGRRISFSEGRRGFAFGTWAFESRMSVVAVAVASAQPIAPLFSLRRAPARSAGAAWVAQRDVHRRTQVALLLARRALRNARSVDMNRASIDATSLTGSTV